MDPSTVKDLLTDRERFAPDVDSVWSAVEARSLHRRVTRRRFVIGTVAAGVAAIVGGTTLGRRGALVATPSPSPKATSQPVTSGPTTWSTASRVTSASAVQKPAAGLVEGRWTRMPPAPISARGGSVGVWTGMEMLIWGGSSSNTPSVDGAAYDPARRRWRTLAAAPAGARANWTGIWTGQALILWGVSRTGVDTRPTGAWYAPDADRWQMVPDSPFGVSAASTTVWTGSAMVALAIPTGNNPELIAAASYDPVDDLWTELPPVTLPTGHPVLFLQAAAVDDTVFLCSRWQLDDEDISNAGTDSFVLDNGAWRPVTFIGPSGINGSAPISTGTSLVQAAARVWAGVDAGPDPGDIAGRLLDLPDRRVTDIAQGPLDRQAPQSLWAGDALVSVTFQGAAAAWDIGTDTWVQLPQAPVVFDDDPLAVWTGTQLLLWGRTEQPANADSATPGVVAVGLELTA